MIENISLSVSIQFTPNISLYSISDQSNNLSNSILNGTNNESTPITDTCTSGDSCLFYTPNASLNSDLKFLPSPTIISNIFTNFQPLSTHNDPLFSRDATEFICNLNPPNSSFVIGASTTQNCKVSLLPISHKNSRSNKVTRVSVSPVKYKQINLGTISAAISENFDLDSSCKNMNYSSRKFCQTTHSNLRKILPRKSGSADESFHTPIGLDPLSHRTRLRTPKDKLLRCTLCSNTYSSKNRYDSHLSRHYTGHNLWICESCNFTFHSRKSYRYHRVNTHTFKQLRRSGRNTNTKPTHTGLPNKVRHSLQKTNKLTPKRFNKSLNDSRLHLVEEQNLSFKIEDSFSHIEFKAASTPLLPIQKSKRRYIKKDKSYAEDKISPENAFSDEKPDSNVKQDLGQVLKSFRCDQCTRSCSTLRALNIHKFMHKRLAINSSSNDVTRPLPSKRKLRQISARTSPCRLCEFDCNLHVLQC